ncbi:MAG: BrnT family toxin [Elusimicrobiota bacterium]
MYTEIRDFEWDPTKASRNSLKHGTSFQTASFAFDDPDALTIEDHRHSTHEARRWLIGDSGSGVLVVVFTIRPPGKRIRIISARRAGRTERRRYEEEKRFRLFESPPGHS